METVKYLIDASLYTKNLEKTINEAQGKLQQLSDNKILISFDFANYDELNKKLQQIVKSNPQLTIQFQYDVNKKLLDNQLEKLEKIKALQIDVDTKVAGQKIDEMFASFEDAYNNDESDEILEKKVRALLEYANTVEALGNKVSERLLRKLKEYDDIDIVDKLLKNNKVNNPQLFNVTEGIDKALENTQNNIEFLQRSLNELRNQGAMDLGAGSGSGNGTGNGKGIGIGADGSDDIKELSDRIEGLTLRINEMRQELLTLSGEPFNEMTLSVQKLEEELSSAIAQIKALKDAGVTIGGNVGNSSSNAEASSGLVSSSSNKTRQDKYYDSVWEDLYDKQKKDRDKQEAYYESVLAKSNEAERKAVKETEKIWEGFYNKQAKDREKQDEYYNATWERLYDNQAKERLNAEKKAAKDNESLEKKQADYYDSVWEGLYDKQAKERLNAENKAAKESEALQKKESDYYDSVWEGLYDKQAKERLNAEKKVEKENEALIKKQADYYDSVWEGVYNKQAKDQRRISENEEKFRESVLYGQAKKRLSDEKKEENRQISAKDTVEGLLRRNKAFQDEDRYVKEFVDDVKQLESQLETLSKKKIIDENELKDAKIQFEEISKEALKLENQVVDPTKKIKLLNEIDQYAKKYSGLSKSTRDALSKLADGVKDVESKADLKELYNDFVKIQMAARDAGEETQSMLATIGSRIKELNAKFIAQFLSWQDMIRYVRELTSNVVALDSALTELRKVSDASTERLAQSFEKSADTALELGQSVEHVINVTADWSRLGYDVDAAEELARVTALFTTVGDNMTADAASSYLISTLQGYQMSADQALDIVDKYNQVANRFAIDTAGIGEALQRSAASFYSANTDLSKSIALITATNEVIQNPESVGTLWKTLSARIRGAKTELEELGEEEDSFTETTSNLRDLVKSLTNFDIMKNENEYKDIYEIILGIGEAWDDLTDIEQASLAEALAGKRNSNALLAVMGNLDTLRNAYKEAERAAGSAEKEQENYARSVQYSLDRFQASVEKISYSLLNSDFLKSLVESGVTLLDILDAIVSKTSGLVSILAGAGASLGFAKVGGFDIFDDLKNNYKELQNVIKGYNEAASESALAAASYIESLDGTNDIMVDYLKNLKRAPGSMKNYIAALLKAKASTIGVELATAAMNAAISIGISMLTTLAVSGISYLINRSREAREAAVELADTYKSESETLDEQISQYQELSEQLRIANEKGEDTYGIKEQLLSLQDKLNSVYGDEYEKLNLVNGAYTDQIAILQNLSKQKALDFLSENSDQFDDMDKYLDKIRTYRLGSISTAHHSGLLSIFDKYEGITVGPESYGARAVSIKANIENADQIMQDLYADLEEYGRTHDLDVSWLTDAIALERRKISEDDKYSDYKKLREQYVNATIASREDLSDSFDEAIEAVDNYNKALESGEGVEAAKENLDKVREQVENTTFDSKAIRERFLSVFDGIDDALEKRHTIDEAFASKDNDFMKYAEKLKGLTDIEVANLTDPTLKASFNYILHSLGLTEENAGLLIDKLVELGIVQRGVAQSAKEMSDAESAWNTERDKALDKLGLRKETSSGVEYDESWTEYLKTIKELNPEIADNAMEVEKCALANMQFSKAVEDLSKNFKTYKEALKDADKLTPEYSEAVNSLADDLTYLTGIDFSIEDAAKFLSDVENVQLLEKALNGSDEALKKLQERASEGISIEIDTSSTDKIREVIQEHLSDLPDEYQLRLNLDSELFNTEIENFANWLNENSDMGEIDVYALLDSSPFMQALATLMSESSEVATAVKKMFADLGWEVKWDTKKMPIPTGSKITSLYIPNDVPKEIRDKYTNAAGGAVKWDYVDVPTNIQYVPKGKGKTTSTSKYTPTSLSPTQKSSAKTNIDKANGSGKDKKDDYKEFIDYFERMIKVLDQSVDLLEAHLEDVVGSFAKNTLLDAEEELIQSKMNGYSSAIDMYSKKASEALSKIPSDIAEKIQNGAVAIDEFIGEGNKDVVEAIEEYEQWADKVNDCKQQLVELKEAIRQLELQKFNNIMEDFTNQFDLRQSAGIDLISKQVDLLKEAGELIGESFYKKQIEQATKQLGILNREQEALVKQLNEALDSGIDTGSEEWLEMVNSLTKVKSSILDCEKAIEEFDNALLELHTEIFNRIQDQFSAFASELSNMQQLINDDANPVATVKNQWTDEGLAQLGLLAQQYELAKYQVAQYNEEIERLNQLYLQGKYSTTEYADKLIELKNAQWSAVNASEAALENIRELNEQRVNIVVEGINEEIEAYEKLIQAQKDSLSAEKDLHEYRKQIADESKAIVDIQRQLAAIENDNSQAARAKRAKLEEQLKEAQDALSETEYAHSIEAEQDALDKQLEQYKETRQAEIDALQESLLNVEQILSDTFEAVRANSQLIGETILAQAQAHGIEMSQALTDAWFAGENAIAHYGEILSAATSNFIGEIQGVEFEVYELQNQANITSDSLANMFATRADNLVNELERSYYSEYNLDQMTNALHDSLSHTIDGNYSGGGAVSALNSIASAADGVAESARNAASALREMLSAQAEEPKETKTRQVTIYGGYDGNGNYVGSRTATVSSNGSVSMPKATTSSLNNTKFKKKAIGDKHVSRDMLAWTQEHGPEAIINPADGSILTPLQKGSAVLPADQTSNIWEWSRFDPEEFANKLIQSIDNVGGEKVQANTMQVGSLVTVNGNVNDSMAMMEIASTTASTKIKQSFKELSNNLNK